VLPTCHIYEDMTICIYLRGQASHGNDMQLGPRGWPCVKFPYGVGTTTVGCRPVVFDTRLDTMLYLPCVMYAVMYDVQGGIQKDLEISFLNDISLYFLLHDIFSCF
jgi:hypothetical protein